MKNTNLFQKIGDRKAKVGVMGLGYVGLPLAFEFAKAGFETIGIEINEGRVRSVNEGINYVQDIDNLELKELVQKGRLKATSDFSILKELDSVSICVPTPLNKNKEPDMSYIVNSIEEVSKYLHPGQLVILESTTYPGTTEEIVLPLLEKEGLHVGVDFFLAFSPERIDPGNKQYQLRNTPKVIGGITPSCAEAAQSLYQIIIDRVVPVSSPRAAELVKLLENTFRAINIGLANEVALMCDVLKIDVWEVIEAAKTKPFGFMPFYPGPGLGGHCIPIDSHYLSWKLKSHDFYSQFIELAAQVNNNMPHHIVQKIARILNDQKKSVNGSSLLILGVSYKRDIGDLRESPSLTIMTELQKMGASLSYHDPFVPSLTINETRYESSPLNSETLQKADCAIVTTDHSSFDYGMILENSRVIFDSRNAIKVKNSKVVKL